MRRAAFVSVVLAVVWGCLDAPSAQQWPASVLVLRTNGAFLKAGECVRLSLVATEDVHVPFTPSLSYAFDRVVTVKDTVKDKEMSREELRRALIDRPVGAAIDHLPSGASVLLDDTLCFGSESEPGPYGIRVALSGVPSPALETCVEFRPDDREPGAGCDFALRGVVRRDTPGAVILDASAGSNGPLRLLAFRGDRLLGVIDDSVAVMGPQELSVAGGALEGLGAGPVDLVLHDWVTLRSASAARLVVGR